MTILACLLLVAQLAVPSPNEIDSQLDAVRRQIVDSHRPVEQRASIALEEAGSLDKLAQNAATPEDRRRRAIQAITLLDDFNAANPGHSLQVPIALQAAVYLWADGRREFDDWRLAPRNESRKTRARELFDGAITRLERIEPALSGTEPLVAQNARFRLAQALSDRAQMESPGSDAERNLLRRARAALDPVPTEAEVAGFARCLLAEIRARLGDFDAADNELEAARKSKIPPAPESLLETQILVLCGARRFSSAIKAIDESKLDPLTRAVLGIRVRLAQRRTISAGQARREADDDALNRGQLLRGSPRVDARLALNDLAREIDLPPDRSDPDAWDLLADGALNLGDASRASRLIELGADRAITQGRHEDAGRLRLRAAAILFQEGDFNGADAVLTRLWNDPKAGPSRPKAGMLRVLARGRLVPERSSEATRARYVEALKELERDYPSDPITDEARWLLGRMEIDAGRVGEAIAEWEKIPPGRPRWLTARLAIAEQYQRELDELRIASDPNLLSEKYKSAAAFLRNALLLVGDSSEATELELAAIRLDLTPGIGRPDLARSLAEQVAHHSGSEAQHARARLFRVVALAETQRFPDAEHAVRIEAARSTPEDLLLTARLLDHSADTTGSDLNRSRLGRILQILLQIGSRHFDALSAPSQAEFRLRMIRAEIAIGDTGSARRDFAGPKCPTVTDLDPDGLRDLADAYMRVEAYGMAVDVERFLARKLKPGTPAALESRYVLALALFKDRKPADARRIIDATAILYPDLGSGTLKARFERLRQRIEPE